MNIHIDDIELLWIAINFVTLALTVSALIDARADLRAVFALNGRAREINALAAVRREKIRVVVQALFLALVVPGLFDDHDTSLNYFVVILMSIPIVILVSTLLDARTRRLTTSLVAAEVIADRETVYSRLEAASERILAAIAKASDTADARADAMADARETIDDTHDKVVDMHDAMDPHANAPTS